MKRRMNLSGVQSLAVASQLAFVLAACVLIGIFGGSYLDARLGTGGPWLLIVGSILGTAAGIYSMWKTTTFMMERLERRNRPKGPEA